MHIEFIGAAQTVTGSKHFVRTPHANIMLDFGLFQGRRKDALDINQQLGCKPSDVDAVVLSHAHIDHSGALPILTKHGYQGPIYATPATRDLCAVMLADAAQIQKMDAEYIHRAITRDQADMQAVEPLYDAHDVTRVLSQMVSVPYHHRVPIAEGVSLSFFDAGHVLGSAITVLDIDDRGKQKRLVFTGDLGRAGMSILRDPEVVDNASVLITESTYGDRMHAPMADTYAALAAVLKRTYERGGKVIIPSFALERAQEIVFALKKLDMRGALPPMPVCIDSPLTVKITEVFKLHPDCYDEEARQHMQRGPDVSTSAKVVSGSSDLSALKFRDDAGPFEFSELVYVGDRDDSKALTMSREPCVIISASGMCEAGRIVHHLKAHIENEKNTIVIVGFQAQHTLGRRIVERRPRVRIFGVERELKAEVVVLNGFSAHADQSDLLKYATQTRSLGNLEHLFLVHGDPAPQRVLQGLLTQQGFASIHVPQPRDLIEI